MRIAKEIVTMYLNLPEYERVIFNDVFGDISLLSSCNNRKKQIMYNILLWRKSVNVF